MGDEDRYAIQVAGEKRGGGPKRLAVDDEGNASRGEAGLSNSGLLSADKAVKEASGAVYWLTVSDMADLAIELNDSKDNSKATDEWGIDLPAGGYAHFIFDPPIEFDTGIYLDVSTATCKVTIGYI